MDFTFVNGERTIMSRQRSEGSTQPRLLCACLPWCLTSFRLLSRATYCTHTRNALSSFLKCEGLIRQASRAADVVCI